MVLIQILIRHPQFLIPGCNPWLIQGLIHGQTLILGLIQTSMTKGVQRIDISGLINTNFHAQKNQWVHPHHHSHPHKTWNKKWQKKSPLPPTMVHDNQNPWVEVRRSARGFLSIPMKPRVIFPTRLVKTPLLNIGCVNHLSDGARQIALEILVCPCSGENRLLKVLIDTGAQINKRGKTWDFS